MFKNETKIILKYTVWVWGYVLLIFNQKLLNFYKKYPNFNPKKLVIKLYALFL